MSIQSECSEIQKKSTKFPQSRQSGETSPNIIEWNGVDREIMRIKIDDPSTLDSRIQKNQRLLEKAERIENICAVAGAVGLLFSFCVAPFAISLLLVINSGVAIIPYLLGAAGLATALSVPALTISDDHRKIAEKTKPYVKKLQVCKQDMETEKFQIFAKPFGNDSTLEELFKVHRLFLVSTTIQQEEQRRRASLEGDLCLLKRREQARKNLERDVFLLANEIAKAPNRSPEII